MDRVFTQIKSLLVKIALDCQTKQESRKLDRVGNIKFRCYEC